tara:strand:- start:835 stop:1188 length:354 start_codon:yes stop_codon:yes gene_type:complete
METWMSLAQTRFAHNIEARSHVRFSDIRLGQPVSLTQSVDGAGAIGDCMCDLVRQWSGSPRASLVSLHQPAGGLTPDTVAGHVLARHLDGSNQADVEILGRAQDTICLRAVVRVALA